MNKNLSLRRMTLLGFMLMTMSINVLANNTNEEERNTTTVVVEKSVNRSVAEEYDEYMTISLQDEDLYIFRLSSTLKDTDLISIKLILPGKILDV